MIAANMASPAMPAPTPIPAFAPVLNAADCDDVVTDSIGGDGFEGFAEVGRDPEGAALPDEPDAEELDAADVEKDFVDAATFVVGTWPP